MASKKSVNAENLAALGAERLAAILMDLAEHDADTKRRLRLELAGQAGGRVAGIRGGGAMTPTPFWAHAMRTDSGRPRSSMRLRTWTATSISVARRSSVCERSPSPITRLNRPMVASARARALYPDAFCQAILPFSAMSSRWRSRWVGAVSAVALGTAVERGGTMTAASGWRSATLA